MTFTPANIRTLSIAAAFTAALLFSAGCRKPDPIDLTSPPADSPVKVEMPETTPPPYFGLSDVDSVGLFTPPDGAHLGQLLIEGAEYDASFGNHQILHHEGTLARAIFFNPNLSVVAGRDTAYSSVDVGTLVVDSSQLKKIPKLYTPENSTIPTRLGIQYLLLTRDMILDGGLMYLGSHTYEWDCNGGLPTGNSIRIDAPPKLRVIYPTALQFLHSSEDLHVRWFGGGDSVSVLIRSLEGNLPGKVLVRLAATVNTGGMVLPKSLLSLLPQNQTQFFFTFTSSKTGTTHIEGYPRDVFVQTTTSHTVLLTLR
ncbi:MAG TPA: hypothetical protein VKS81_07510 [Bacteroidota bacterium]|nr:hypothetical protein [Bacteroidota bacterium]